MLLSMSGGALSKPIACRSGSYCTDCAGVAALSLEDRMNMLEQE